MSAQYVKQFNADMGELSLNLTGGSHWKRYAASSILTMQSKIHDKKILFIKKNVERIEIFINGEVDPYIIEKGMISDDYQWAKSVLKSFAEKNKVKFEE